MLLLQMATCGKVAKARTLLPPTICALAPFVTNHRLDCGSICSLSL